MADLAMFAETFPVIGGDHDQGVLQQAPRGQRIEERPDLLVDESHLTPVEIVRETVSERERRLVGLVGDRRSGPRKRTGR